MTASLSRTLIVAACIALAAAQAPAADVPPADQILATLTPGHPRLLINADGFDRLKAHLEADADARALYERLRGEADDLLDAPPREYEIPDGKRLLRVSRAVLDRVRLLAVIYKVSGERRYLDRAWAELDKAAGFKDWNPSHFLDTAEMTHAFALGYDWLYHDWTEAQRETLRTAIVRHGLEPGLKSYRGQERYGWWVQAVHNWNQVCNGGMLAGALALADEEPELCAEIVRAAVTSLPRALKHYGPEGGWFEGPAYWAYATRYTVLALAALDTALGRDFGLGDTPGIAETGWFGIHGTGPIGQTFSFADSGTAMPRASFMWWLARRYGEPRFAHFAADRPEPGALDLLWHQTLGELDAPPRDAYFKGVEVATMRSAWNDPSAGYLAIQAGSNAVNHNHLDLGSFVFDALGERWVVDMKHDDYNLPGYFGGKRYQYYRNRAESHNTLLIAPGGGPEQSPKAAGRIERFEADGASPFAIADLTRAYAPAATSVKRGVMLADRRDALIVDEIELAEPALVYWLLHTPAQAEASADGRSVKLTLGAKSVTMWLLAPADAQFSVDAAGPFDWSPMPEGQDATPDLRRLTVRIDGAGSLTVAVRIEVGGGERDVELRALSAW